MYAHLSLAIAYQPGTRQNGETYGQMFSAIQCNPVPFLVLSELNDVAKFSTRLHLTGAWGRCSVGQVGHGPPKILVGWATMHLAPPVCSLVKLV